MYIKYLLAAVLLIALLFGGAYFWLTDQTPEVQSTSDRPQFDAGPIVPFGPSTASQGGGAVSSKTFVVASAKGGTMEVRNMYEDPDTLMITSPRATSSVYYSLGSAPLTEIDGMGTTTPGTLSALERGFEILYFPEEGSFSIALLKEPIAETRRSMVIDLEQRLGISGSDLCDLVAEVLVAPAASQFYAYKNVGFPGCPGATRLPGD
ncbi:MAG: hypothetical protein AAB955_03665 [Patescibacteria group bacterium]